MTCDCCGTVLSVSKKRTKPVRRLGDLVANKIYRALSVHGTLTRTKICHEVLGRNRDKNTVEDALTLLEHFGLANRLKEQSWNGRPTEVWQICGTIAAENLCRWCAWKNEELVRIEREIKALDSRRKNIEEELTEDVFRNLLKNELQEAEKYGTEYAPKIVPPKGIKNKKKYMRLMRMSLYRQRGEYFTQRSYKTELNLAEISVLTKILQRRISHVEKSNRELRA